MNVVGGGRGGGVGKMLTLERIGWWSEVAKHEKVKEGFRVGLMTRSRVWPTLWVGIVTCCVRLMLERRSWN